MNKFKPDGKKMLMLRQIYEHQYKYKSGYWVSTEGRPPFHDRTIQELLKRGLIKMEREWNSSWFRRGRNRTLLFLTPEGAKILGVNYDDTKADVCS